MIPVSFLYQPFLLQLFLLHLGSIDAFIAEKKLLVHHLTIFISKLLFFLFQIFNVGLVFAYGGEKGFGGLFVGEEFASEEVGLADTLNKEIFTVFILTMWKAPWISAFFLIRVLTLDSRRLSATLWARIIYLMWIFLSSRVSLSSILCSS